MFKSEEVRRVVDRRMNTYIKKLQEKNPEMDEETIEKKKNRKRTALINDHKVIFQAFNGAKFDNHFVFKSK